MTARCDSSHRRTGIYIGPPSWLSRSAAYGTSRRRERFLPAAESSILQLPPFVPGVKRLFVAELCSSSAQDGRGMAESERTGAARPLSPAGRVPNDRL